MVESRPVAPRARHTGPFSILLSLTGIILFAVLLRIVIESLGLVFLWPEQGAAHSCRVMVTEWEWLKEKAKLPLWLLDLSVNAPRVIRWVMDSFSHFFARLARGYLPSGIHIFTEMVICSGNDIFIRLLRLLQFAPAALLCVIVGFIDGLIARDLRRFNVGNESGFLHHSLRAKIRTLLYSIVLVYLAMPYVIHSTWLVLLSACTILFAFIISASFKKHL